MGDGDDDGCCTASETRLIRLEARQGGIYEFRAPSSIAVELFARPPSQKTAPHSGRGRGLAPHRYRPREAASRRRAPLSQTCLFCVVHCETHIPGVGFIILIQTGFLLLCRCVSSRTSDIFFYICAVYEHSVDICHSAPQEGPSKKNAGHFMKYSWDERIFHGLSVLLTCWVLHPVPTRHISLIVLLFCGAGLSEATRRDSHFCNVNGQAVFCLLQPVFS